MDRKTFLSLGALGVSSMLLTGCTGNQEPTSTGSGAAGSASPGSTDTSGLVMPDWAEGVPYESWSQFEKVDVDDDWFSVYKLPGDVYAIQEDGQWELVISYLVLGSDKALLWDTGMGFGDIKAVVEKLTDLPLTVVLSHHHRDHIGGMHQFDETICFDSEYTVEYLTNGLPHEHADVQAEIGEGMFAKPLPEGCDLDTYHIIGKAPTGTVQEGDVLDLGNRSLEVIHTPGHTADGIMLLDRENSILFTGDTYYPDWLYAFSEDSDLPTYVDTMNKVATIATEANIEWLYTSHMETVHGNEVLAEVATAMQAILDGEKTNYELDEEGLRHYTFDNDIVIITLDEDA